MDTMALANLLMVMGHMEENDAKRTKSAIEAAEDAASRIGSSNVAGKHTDTNSVDSWPAGMDETEGQKFAQ